MTPWSVKLTCKVVSITVTKVVCVVGETTTCVTLCSVLTKLELKV